MRPSEVLRRPLSECALCRGFLALTVVALLNCTARAQDRLRTAIEHAIPLLERASAGSADQRECFTCHNQGLPILALSEARRRGFEVDEENFQRQLDHTYGHLERNRDRYADGTGTGGKADTAGYALWSLSAGGRTADETTEAVVEFLLQWQSDDDHWSCSSDRPPSESSDFTTTFLSLRGLSAYGTEAQRDRTAVRTAAAGQWLSAAAAADNEDRVFRLRALQLAAAGAEVIEAAANDLLSRQRDDGGWSQLDNSEGDAYATATALTALHATSSIRTDDEAYQRGLRFLLDAQLDDGSWHVASRSDPFQTYYESGFPHGDDQFISTASSAWATLALLAACPAVETSEPEALPENDAGEPTRSRIPVSDDSPAAD